MHPSPVSLPILFHYLNDPEQTLFIEHNATLVVGELDVERLQRAFERIIRRHDALRTSFKFDKETGTIETVIHDSCTAQIDVRYASSDNALGVIRDCFKKPLRHDSPHLIRMTVVSLTEDSCRSYIVISASHAILDGTSSRLFNQELGKAYRGEQLDLVECQYSDFALSQHEHLESLRTPPQRKISRGLSLKFWNIRRPSMKDNPYLSAVEYYRKAFKGVPERMNYPLDFPRKDDVKFSEAGRVIMELDQHSLESFEKFVASQGAQSMWWAVLLAGIFFMLRVYSGEGNPIIDVPRTCRPKHMKNVLGHFANEAVICLREDVKAENMTLLQLVRHIWADLGMAAMHAPNIMPEDIRNAIYPESPYGSTPVQVCFTAIEQEWLQIHLAEDIRTEPQEELISLEKAYEDFYIRAFRGEKVIKIILEYNSGLFRPETATCMLRVAIEFVTEWVNKPSLKMKDLRTYSYTSCCPYWMRLRDSTTRIERTLSNVDPCYDVASATVCSDNLQEIPYDRTDVLLSGMSIFLASELKHDRWNLACITRDPSGKNGTRLHLFGCLIPGAETVEGFVNRNSEARREAFDMAIFSFNQQLQLANIPKSGISCCITAGEASADYVFAMDAGVHMCIYSDADYHIKIKYNKNAVGATDVNEVLLVLQSVVEAVSQSPRETLGAALFKSRLLNRRFQTLQSFQCV
jgi:hypothetical protein